MIGGHSARPIARELGHRDAEGAVAREAHDRKVRPADLGADDGGQAVAAGAEEARREVVAPLVEVGIGVADGAVVADVRGDDRLARQRGLDRAPGHAGGHPVRLGIAGALVPGGARIVVLMVHRGELLLPGRHRLGDPRAPRRAALFARRLREVVEDAGRHLCGVADDADGHRLGQADAVGVDVDLNDLRVRGPVIEAVAGQGRERVEARSERQHDVGVADQLHRGLRAVVAKRPDEERMRAREGVVVLVAHADRRIEALGQPHRGGDPALREHHARAVQDHRAPRAREQRGGLADRVLAARRGLERDRLGNGDVDRLRPEIARHVDLGRAGEAPGLRDHARQNLGHAGGVAHLLLVGDHVLEQLHLLDLLEAALTDGLVGGLGRHEEERRVVPVGGLHGGDEVGDARPVLGDHHRHLAGGAGVAVGHHPGRALVRAIPEGDARLRGTGRRSASSPSR